MEGLCLSGALERGWPPETPGPEWGNAGQTLPVQDGLCFPEAEARGWPGTERSHRAESGGSRVPADHPSRSVPAGRPGRP